MKPILKKDKAKKSYELPVATASQPFDSYFNVATASPSFERELYSKVRATLPVVDAAIGKLIRLVGNFSVKTDSEATDELFLDFKNDVRVNLSSASLGSFIEQYLDNLITYGKAVGEILVDEATGEVVGLLNTDSENFHVKSGKNPVDRVYYLKNGKKETLIKNPKRILFTALNPTFKNPEGVSLLRGVPQLWEILMKIYSCIGKNFDRLGNVRYAVTYKPSGEADGIFSKDRATLIAKEWADGMYSAKCGIIKDFVAVGDIDIKVIGADNQLIDTEVPAKQLMEQILSKLSIPPFLLGLNWTSTERMSTQQVDILTSELEYYRRLLNPVIRQIACEFLKAYGYNGKISIVWDNINLQDEAELSKARLNNAQAEAIEIDNLKKKGE